MKRLYGDTESKEQQTETTSQARARVEEEEDAQLYVQPFGSRTHSDQPANGES